MGARPVDTSSNEFPFPSSKNLKEFAPLPGNLNQNFDQFNQKQHGERMKSVNTVDGPYSNSE